MLTRSRAGTRLEGFPPRSSRSCSCPRPRPGCGPSWASTAAADTPLAGPPGRGPAGHPRLPASQLARVPRREAATTHGARPHEHGTRSPRPPPFPGPLPQKILPPPPHPQDHLLPAPQATLDPAPAPPAPAPWIPRAWCVGRLAGPHLPPSPVPWRARPSRTCSRSLPVGRADRPAGPLRDRNRHRCPPPAGGGGRHRPPRAPRPPPPHPRPSPLPHIPVIPPQPPYLALRPVRDPPARPPVWESSRCPSARAEALSICAVCPVLDPCRGLGPPAPPLPTARWACSAACSWPTEGPPAQGAPRPPTRRAPPQPPRTRATHPAARPAAAAAGGIGIEARMTRTRQPARQPSAPHPQPGSLPCKAASAPIARTRTVWHRSGSRPLALALCARGPGAGPLRRLGDGPVPGLRPGGPWAAPPRRTARPPAAPGRRRWTRRSRPPRRRSLPAPPPAPATRCTCATAPASRGGSELHDLRRARLPPPLGVRPPYA